MRDRFQPAEWLAAFIAARPGLRQGSMFGRRAAFVGRHLLACAWDEALVCRLPPGLIRTALRQRQAVPFKIDGRPMPGWIMYRPGTMTAAGALEPTLEAGARALAEGGGAARKARSTPPAGGRKPAAKAGCACQGPCDPGAEPARASRGLSTQASTPARSRSARSDQRPRVKRAAARVRRSR